MSSLAHGDRLVVRAHGATVSETELLENTGVCVIDATCPFVSKIHEIVKERSDKGDVILIGGNGMHPEVAGIKSRAACSRVFSDSAELESLAENEPELLAKSTTFVWQTTFNLQEFDKCNKIIKKRFKNTKIYDTICNATELRQKQTVELAKISDAMLVVGGKNSSNTNKLYDVAKRF